MIATMPHAPGKKIAYTTKAMYIRRNQFICFTLLEWKVCGWER